MWWMLYYGLPILVAFIVVYRLDLSGLRVLMLSWLPTLLYGLFGFVAILWGNHWKIGMLIAPLYFSFMVYAILFPHLLIAALCVEYIKKNYEIPIMLLAILGGVLGAVLVIVPFVTLKFSFIALITGFASVWIQYYFTERKDAHVVK